jgi:hypothetical protein
MYPYAKKIVILTDNLDTYSPASLNKAFSAEEAHGLANSKDWRFTDEWGDGIIKG